MILHSDGFAEPLDFNKFGGLVSIKCASFVISRYLPHVCYLNMRSILSYIIRLVMQTMVINTYIYIILLNICMYFEITFMDVYEVRSL